MVRTVSASRASAGIGLWSMPDRVKRCRYRTTTSRGSRYDPRMKNHELHRGRLVDHIGLVVKDLAASKRFYTAAFDVLGIPLGGETAEDFWFDELFVSSQASKEAQGKLTGRDPPRIPGAGPRHRRPLPPRGARRRRPRQRRARRACLPSGLLRGFRARPGRQQHRSRLPRRGEALGRFGEDHLRRLRRPSRATRRPASPRSVICASSSSSPSWMSK